MDPSVQQVRPVSPKYPGQGPEYPGWCSDVWTLVRSIRTHVRSIRVPWFGCQFWLSTASSYGCASLCKMSDEFLSCIFYFRPTIYTLHRGRGCIFKIMGTCETVSYTECGYTIVMVESTFSKVLHCYVWQSKLANTEADWSDQSRPVLVRVD